jgi:hypothetical protein
VTRPSIQKLWRRARQGGQQPASKWTQYHGVQEAEATGPLQA